MAIRAIIQGKFKLPDNTQLIGALYWIYCSEVFLKHIEVNIQHCAIISTEEACENFKFIIAKCSQKDLPYECNERKGVFRSDTQYATVKLKRFSIIGPVGPAGGKKYYVALKFYKQVPNSFDVRFCFIVASNCEPHIKTRCDKMKSEGWIIDDDGELQLIDFNEDEITLDLPVDDPVMDIKKNWMLVPRIFPLIRKSEVDGLDNKFSGCTIELQWKGEGEVVSLFHKVTLKGAKPPRNFFTLSYHPCKEKHTNNPVVADVPSDAGSPTANTCCALNIVDLAEVKRCLKNFTDWQSLGLELGLLYNTLESIEECRDVDKCKTKMLARWLEKQDNVASVGVPCWATLEKALRNIEKNELADTIHKYYS